MNIQILATRFNPPAPYSLYSMVYIEGVPFFSQGTNYHTATAAQNALFEMVKFYKGAGHTVDVIDEVALTPESTGD